jgi:cytoskeleton protein RodZ
MSVGKTLHDARIAKNLSIADVAAAIRLRATIIQDIEQDLFDSCGGEVYGRGHQRMYARFLGLDIDSQITTSLK